MNAGGIGDGEDKKEQQQPRNDLSASFTEPVGVVVAPSEEATESQERQRMAHQMAVQPASLAQPQSLVYEVN